MFALFALCAGASGAGNEKELPAAPAPTGQGAAFAPPVKLSSADERGNEKGLRVVSESAREARAYEEVLREKEAEIRPAERAAEAAEGRRHREIYYYRRCYPFWDDWWPLWPYRYYWGPCWWGYGWWTCPPPAGFSIGIGVYHTFPRR